MATKVGINGFGRIGRMVFRAAAERDDIEIVGINDLLDIDYLAYMLKYDSVHGKFQSEVSVEDGSLVVNGSKIRITAERDPSALAWNDVNAVVVVESTGFFLTDETARKHIDAGAKKVILSTVWSHRELAWESVNYKGKLIELCHTKHMENPKFLVSNVSGPEHKKLFEVKVKIGNNFYPSGIGSNKKTAEQHAAQLAIDSIND